MKSQSIGWKLPILIGSLVVIALVIDVYFFNRAKARREADEKVQQRAVAEAAAKEAAEKFTKEKKDTEAETRARLLARYLNTGFTSKLGIATIGVAIQSEFGVMNPTIADALAQRLKSTDIQLLNSYFKPEFFADKNISTLFSGDTSIFDRLELTNSLNAVVIGRQSVSYSTNSSLENTVTANLRLEIVALPIGLSREVQSWNFAANGAGFRAHEARQAAEDRVVEQISKSTNLVLAPIIARPSTTPSK